MGGGRVEVGGRWQAGPEGGGEVGEVGGVGREVAPNRTVPTGTSSKETAGNANRTEPNRNTHVKGF